MFDFDLEGIGGCLLVAALLAIAVVLVVIAGIVLFAWLI